MYYNKSTIKTKNILIEWWNSKILFEFGSIFFTENIDR